MFTKSLLFGASLAALAAADPIPQAVPTSFDPAALSSELASLTASLGSLPSGVIPGLPSFYSDFPTLPASIESVLATAVPSSVLATETDPCAFVTDAPQWYSALPASVKSALTSYESALLSWDKAHSKELASLAGTASYTGTAPALVCTNTGAAVATATASSTAKNTGGAGGSTANAAAPHATGAVAIGLAGAVGVLGLMAAL
jgi:hypothetical protein